MGNVSKIDKYGLQKECKRLKKKGYNYIQISSYILAYHNKNISTMCISRWFVKNKKRKKKYPIKSFSNQAKPRKVAIDNKILREIENIIQSGSWFGLVGRNLFRHYYQEASLILSPISSMIIPEIDEDIHKDQKKYSKIIEDTRIKCILGDWSDVFLQTEIEDKYSMISLDFCETISTILKERAKLRNIFLLEKTHKTFALTITFTTRGEDNKLYIPILRKEIFDIAEERGYRINRFVPIPYKDGSPMETWLFIFEYRSYKR